MSNPTTEKLRKLREARSKLQRVMRRMEHEWWLHKAVDLQREVDENNSAGIFRGLKEVYGPQAQLSISLLDWDCSSITTDPKKIIYRWGQYFGDLLNVETVTDENILSELPIFTR